MQKPYSRYPFAPFAPFAGHTGLEKLPSVTIDIKQPPCPYCGAHLDPCEICDCKKDAAPNTESGKTEKRNSTPIIGVGKGFVKMEKHEINRFVIYLEEAFSALTLLMEAMEDEGFCSGEIKPWEAVRLMRRSPLYMDTFNLLLREMKRNVGSLKEAIGE